MNEDAVVRIPPDACGQEKRPRAPGERVPWPRMRLRHSPRSLRRCKPGQVPRDFLNLAFARYPWRLSKE